MVLGTRLVYGADAQTTTARHGKVSGEPDAVIPHVRFCRGSRSERNSLRQPSLEAAFYLPHTPKYIAVPWLGIQPGCASQGPRFWYIRIALVNSSRSLPHGISREPQTHHLSWWIPFMGNAESNGSSGIDDSGVLDRGKVSGEHRRKKPS